MSDDLADLPQPPNEPAAKPKRGPRGAHGTRGGVKLTEGPVRKQILGLTRYLLLGTIATMTFQVADAYFVAQLGTRELAALAFTFPMVMILHAIAIGLGTGVTAVVSRVIGEGDISRARILTTDSLFLAFFIAVTFAIGGFLAVDPLFKAMGAEPDVLVHIKAYMYVWFFGMPVMIVPLIANSVIRAYGDAKFPSLIMGGSAVLNIFLDPIFIFGAWFIPGLGLAGAAYALLISRFVTFTLSLFVLHFRVHGMVYEWPSLARMSHSWGQLLHIALPSTATQLIQPVSAAILTTLIASYGASAIAAYGVATRIEMFSLIFVMSLSIAMGPFVGQNAGAGRMDRVKESMRFAYKAVLVYGFIVAGLLAVFGSYLAHEFSEDTAVIALAAFYLLVVPISYGCMGIINISSGSLNSLAKPMPAMAIGISKSMVVQLPCAYAGSALYGVKGVFIGMAAATFIVSVLAFVLARRAINGELALMPRPSAHAAE
jgi:putative MATE family efflux protein